MARALRTKAVAGFAQQQCSQSFEIDHPSAFRWFSFEVGMICWLPFHLLNVVLILMNISASSKAALHDDNGHHVAAVMRRRKQVSVLPAAPIDSFVWFCLVLLALAGGGGLGAGLWWIQRPPPPPGMVEMKVGADRLVFPSSYKGPRLPDMAREVGMTRLRVTWPELSAPGPTDRADVHITIGPADPATDPQAHFATLARFLTPGAWSNPGGLVTRSFKKGSPFETEELFMSMPDGAAFFARCTADIAQVKLDEGCRATLKHRGFDIALRFPRDALTEWRALSDGVKNLVDGFRQPG